MYYVTRLDNGLTIATAEMPHLASVSVGLWLGMGSRYEPARLNGICHFIEHMLFKGTRQRSAKQISQAIEGVGGYLNAFTSEETTCFHARAGHEHFEAILDVLMDMLLESKLAEPDIAKEREVIKEEIAMYLDQPQHHVQELLNATCWRNQPLGRSITGTKATLDAMRRADLAGFLKQNYLASNTCIVAAGKVTHRQHMRAVAGYSSRLPRDERPRFSAARDEQVGPRIRLFTKETEQTQIALGLRTCSRHDPRRYALRLLNAVLGENMSSRLFQVVREERGLAYSIYSTTSFFDDTGDLVITAGLETEKLCQALRLILRELQVFRNTPPGAGELRRARDYILGQVDLNLESADGQMNWAGDQLVGYRTIQKPVEFKRRLRSVTPGDLRAVARDFFRPDRLNLALVSPLKSDRQLVGVIKKFT